MTVINETVLGITHKFMTVLRVIFSFIVVQVACFCMGIPLLFIGNLFGSYQPYVMGVGAIVVMFLSVWTGIWCYRRITPEAHKGMYRTSDLHSTTP